MHKHPFASVPFTTVCKRLSNARIPDVGTIGCGAGSRRDSSGAACGNLANDTLQNSANAIASTPAHPRRNVVIHTRWPRERAGWTRAGCVASGPCEQAATKLKQCALKRLFVRLYVRQIRRGAFLLLLFITTRRLSGPLSTGSTITMDGGVADATPITHRPFPPRSRARPKHNMYLGQDLG